MTNTSNRSKLGIRHNFIGHSCSKRLTATTATDLPVSMTNCLFQPVYRVKCYANNVKYELILDAQSGAVLYREVDD